MRAGAVLAAVLVLAGCSASDPSIDDGTAQTLDAAVVAVAERASVDDYAGALTELDALQAALDSALSSGGVTADRGAVIQTQVDTVRSDLDALLAAVPAPSETPEPAPEQTEEAPVEEAPVEEAPVEETPVEEAPVEEAPAEDTPTEEAPAPDPVEEEPEEQPEPEEPAAPSDEDAPGTGVNGNNGNGNGNDGNGNSGNGNSGNGNGNSGNGNGNGDG